jgi:hypothetical protein
MEINRSVRDQTKLIKRLKEQGQIFDLTDFVAAEVLGNKENCVQATSNKSQKERNRTNRTARISKL